MSFNKRLGKKGEELAVIYLQKKKFKIIATNWRSGRFEIDIIAQHKNTLHFIEVKTRSTPHFGSPESAVNEKKVQHIMEAASVYLDRHPPSHESIQFDVISILMNSGTTKIDFFEDIYIH